MTFNPKIYFPHFNSEIVRNYYSAKLACLAWNPPWLWLECAQPSPRIFLKICFLIWKWFPWSLSVLIPRGVEIRCALTWESTKSRVTELDIAGVHHAVLSLVIVSLASGKKVREGTKPLSSQKVFFAYAWARAARRLDFMPPLNRSLRLSWSPRSVKLQLTLHIYSLSSVA